MSALIPDPDILQTYVDSNAELHAALGLAPGAHLELHAFACGEYNTNYAFDIVEPDSTVLSGNGNLCNSSLQPSFTCQSGLSDAFK